MTTLVTKMLIVMCWARTQTIARVLGIVRPATMRGSPAATSVPNTSSSISRAIGSETDSARLRSCSDWADSAALKGALPVSWTVMPDGVPISERRLSTAPIA